MDSNKLDEAVRETVANIILRVSANVVPKRTSSSIINEAIEEMQSYPGDLATNLASIETLCSLAFQSENRKIMASHRLTQLLCERIYTFGRDEAFARNASCLISMMLFQDNASREEFARNNGIVALKNVLRCHSTSVHVIQNTIRALRNATWTSDMNCQAVMESKSLSVLLEQLSFHSNNHEVANEILACLGNMIYTSSVIREVMLSNPLYRTTLLHELAVIVGKAGHADLVCTMLIHLANHDVPQERCSLENPVLRLVEVQGLDDIASIFEKAFRSQVEQELLIYCNLTKLLSLSTEFKSSVAGSAWFRNLLQVLDRSRQSAVVLIAVLETIASVISGNDKSKRAFNELDDMDAQLIVIGVMKEKMLDEAVVLECCRVLVIAMECQVYSCADVVRNKEIIGKATAGAMADHGQNVLIQEKGCLILIKLANHNVSYSNYLLRLGVENLVEMAKYSHPAHPALEPVSNQLLTLLRSNPSRGQGPGNVRKTASMRLRSRSRTIEQGPRARSRAGRSRSPNRMLMNGRKAFDAARKKIGEATAKGGDSFLGNSSDPAAVSPLIRSRGSDRKKMTLEPVLE